MHRRDGGRCPACKEVIQKAAILCRHCCEIFANPARLAATVQGPNPLMAGPGFMPGSGGCGCAGRSAGAYPGPLVMQDAARHAASMSNGKTRIAVPLTQILERAVSGTSQQQAGSGGGGGGGGGTHCHWRIALEPCTLCFPFTNWCWEDRCLVIEFECTGGSAA